MIYHAIERTSPKGTRFVGTCWQCGRTGLSMDAVREECDNPAGMTQNESLFRAIEGNDPPDDEGKPAP
jgi:hypothetical protein